MRLIVALSAALLLVAGPASPESEKQSPDVAEVLKSIAGKESLPAGEVFHNVKLMKDVPAAQFLRIMDHSFTASLGVGCEHCHVEGRWEADDKRTKRTARDMIGLVREINDKLGTFEEIDNSEMSPVTCMTCHRGHVKPADGIK